MNAADLSRAHLRVARPTDDLDAVVRFYRDGLGLPVLGSFAEHDGFDGVLLGDAASGRHLGFTRKNGHPAGRAPTPDNLLVFYLPDGAEWRSAVDRLRGSGHTPVASFNPYWDRDGATFEDPDGYRVVLQNAHPPAPVWAILDIQRDDPALGTQRLIADYEAGPGLLRDAVAGMTREQLTARPVEGRWSTLEVVCHVCDSEQFFADRLKRTLALDRPLLVAADPGPYLDAVRYHDRDVEEELALVELARRQAARILKCVPAEAWLRIGVHSEGGPVSLRQLLLHATRHLVRHVGFVLEKRAALGLPRTNGGG